MVAAMESLGRNCEFGLVQRYFGIEPMGLLRFAGSPLCAVTAGLRIRFESIGRDMTFSVDSMGEWIGTWGGLTFHSTCRANDTSEPAVRAQEGRRLPRLAEKLIADLEIGEKLFVFADPGLAIPEGGRAVWEAMRTIGPSSLFLVMADPERAGSVIQHDDGFLVGYVRRLTSAEFAADYDRESWEAILPLAHALWRGSSTSVADDALPARSSWPYGVALPHRYSAHYEQYQALGGLVDVAEDARAYAGSEPLRDVERFLTDQWHSLAQGQSTQVLLDGWSTPEDWGVWGVGASHRIRIAAASHAPGAMILECEVWAYLPGDRLDRTFDVVVDGELMETWHFSPGKNRAVRSLSLSGGPAGHTVEFRPRSVVSPRDIDPSHQDGRPLGLALSRFRLIMHRISDRVLGTVR